MSIKVIINNGKISTNSFFSIVQNIIKSAEKNNNSVIEVIDWHIEYLDNYKNPDYEKKTDLIDIKTDIEDKNMDTVVKDLKRRLIEVKERYEKKEKEQLKAQEDEARWLQIEKAIDEDVLSGEKGTEIEILQRLIENTNQDSSEYQFDKKDKKIVKRLKVKLEKAKKIEEAKKREQEKVETEKRIVEEALAQIDEIVGKEFEAGNIKNKANYLTLIRDAITGQNEGIDLNIKVGKNAKKQLVQLLNGRIKTEEDELYFEQVRNFTNNFEFLSAEEMILKGVRGKMTKFSDREASDRYYSLREKIQMGYNESLRIEELLKNDELEVVDRRILMERKKVLDKQKEKDLRKGIDR